MKQVLIRQGRAVVEEMPAPTCGRGEILVRTAWSLISAGTESATLAHSAPPSAGTVWARRARKAAEVAKLVLDQGVSEARAVIEARLEGESLVTGYSLSGTILEVGRDVDDLVPGQRVACAGSASAHHAELVAVPRNLAVAVPKGLELREAASVTLGAIALQGVRQADLRLGETALVVGLGLVGQLTVALLRASGVRVLGSDVSPSRVARALEAGAEEGVVVGVDPLEAIVDRWTSGYGVDAVVLTAGTASSQPVRQAFRAVRRKGRVVVVGDVGLDLEREAFYMKEAELRISCSYGPGRYDPTYENEGIDYPYGFVRWTENRNMEAYLRFLAEDAVSVARWLDREFAIADASEAYSALVDGDAAVRPLGVLLRYADAAFDGTSVAPARSVPVVARKNDGGVQVALVGPGSFANEVHLPNLASLGSKAVLRAVVSRSPNTARETARRFAAPRAGTALSEVLADPSIDLVMICTRHDRHATEAADALRAGKAVFLEKPAALSLDDLNALATAVRASGRPFVVGFNRRFAPDISAILPLLANRRGPLVATYRVNAGRLPPGHWALGPEGGGRLIGEACHMIDLLRHLAGSRRVGHAILVAAPPAGRSDLPLGDNFMLTCSYADGSLSTLAYTSTGDAAAGKERLELHWDGMTAIVEDFRDRRIYGAAGSDTHRERPDKGHRELLRRTVAWVAGTEPEPIPLNEILDVSRFVLELDREVRGGAPAAPER